jgi:ATP-dependent RNA helicase RhlE
MILNDFNSLGLAAPLLKALATENYVTPTPVQAQAIPFVMEGRDLLGVAQTGTGKTAAFALPMLHRLSADKKPTPRRACRALVLSPTRELASQIAESFTTYGANLPLTVAVIFGGVKIGKQIRDLSYGVDILVATPGRLLDLVNQRAVSLGEVETIVLDEADQMLDMGFIHDIKKLVAMVPKKRQSLFFSATMPKDIAELADRFLTNPARVSVAPVATTAERIDQQVIFVETSRKQALLTKLLDDRSIERALVFTRTKHGADRVVRRLAAAGIPAAAIHGNKSQPQREKALADFRDGRSRLLVATDIAARGIDVDAVTHVINFDLPNVPESYVHRIGRTARAGAAGIAISFCDGEERAFLRDIERLTRLKVPVAPLPADLPIIPDAPRGESREESGPRGHNGRGAGQGRGYGRPAPRAEGQRPRHEGRPGGQRADERPRPARAEQAGEPRREHQPRPAPAQPQGEMRQRPSGNPGGRMAHAGPAQGRTEKRGSTPSQTERARYGDRGRPAEGKRSGGKPGGGGRGRAWQG